MTENKTQKTKKHAEKKPEKKGYKVRNDLGFKKRNFYIDSRNVLLEAGVCIDEKTYNLFNDYCKKTFFEHS